MIIVSPLSFVRNRVPKPAIVDVVEIESFPVKCHNGCGVFYTATLTGADSCCPDCHEEPKPHRIGQAEAVQATVRTALGTVNAVEFRKTLGPAVVNGVSRRALGAPPAAVSTAVVSAAKENLWR